VLKGALLLWGEQLREDIVSREDTFFLNQIEKDPNILNALSPPVPQAGKAPPWDY
jgi:hypothetical protein